MRSSAGVVAAGVAALALALGGCAERLPDDVSGQPEPTLSASASATTTPASRSASPSPEPQTARTTAPPPVQTSSAPAALPDCSAEHLKLDASPASHAEGTGEQTINVILATDSGCRIDDFFRVAVINSAGNEVDMDINYSGTPGELLLQPKEVETAYFSMTWPIAYPGEPCAEPVDATVWRIQPPGGGEPIELEAGLPPEADPCGFRMTVPPAAP